MAKTITHQGFNMYFGDKDLPAGRQDHLQISQTAKFSDLIFETLSERKPSSEESKIFELILNLSIDHGEDTPSALEVIKKAREGENIAEAIAEGVGRIGDTHGGAGKPLMEILYRIKNESLKVKDLVTEYLQEGKRIPGFGHRIYKDEDPRVLLIFSESKNLGLNQDFIEILKETGRELEAQKMKKLPINIDGAMAAIFCGMDLKPEFAIAAFIIARSPGLCAHYLNNTPI